MKTLTSPVSHLAAIVELVEKVWLKYMGLGEGDRQTLASLMSHK
jgi:hypothetical protein